MRLRQRILTRHRYRAHRARAGPRGSSCSAARQSGFPASRRGSTRSTGSSSPRALDLSLGSGLAWRPQRPSVSRDGVEVVGVSTLSAFAAPLLGERRVLRRQRHRRPARQVYFECFDSDGAVDHPAATLTVRRGGGAAAWQRHESRGPRSQSRRHRGVVPGRESGGRRRIRLAGHRLCRPPRAALPTPPNRLPSRST